jgi:hypothetical protein
VFVPIGSVYELVPRAEGEGGGGRYKVQGFCFVHGSMGGEEQVRERKVVRLCSTPFGACNYISGKHRDSI